MHSAISGRTVARLFDSFSDDRNRIRTTPTASPAPTSGPSRVGGTASGPSQSGGSRVAPTTAVTANQTSIGSTRPSVTPTPAARTSSGSSRYRTEVGEPSPAPILKKSPAPSIQSSGAGSVRSPGNLSIDSATTVVAGSSTMTSPQRPQVQRSPSGPIEKRKPGTPKLKTRPSPGRKRSSQGAVPTVRKGPLSPGLPPPRDQKPSITYSDEASDSRGPESSNTVSTFALPSSSWQDVSPSQSQQINLAESKPSSWLVDKNFRDRFAEHQKRAASHSNLQSLAKSSSVRFMDELPERTKGKQRYSEIDTHGNVIRDEMQKEESARRTDEESGQEDIAVDDEGGSPGLPRTKSQLSMMIQHERRVSGNLPPEPPPNSDENVDPVRPTSSTEDDDDEDYFVMGMGVGQTRVRTGKSKAKGKGKAKADEPFSGQGSTSRPAW